MRRAALQYSLELYAYVSIATGVMVLGLGFFFGVEEPLLFPDFVWSGLGLATAGWVVSLISESIEK